MRENNERDLFFTQKIRNMAYNTKYNFLKLFEEYDKDSFGNLKDEIYILGKKFVIDGDNTDKTHKQIYQIFQTTPWITYRSGFPQLPNEVVGSYVSDTGWGCMVRVGQMLFAEVIKHHLKRTLKSEILNILTFFSDFDKTQPFSIHKIARIARIEYGLKPGDWYNPSQISFILAELHEEALSKQQKLKFVVFNSGNLFFDSITDAMLGQEKPQCSCKNKLNKQFICSTCNVTVNAVSLIVLCRLGLNFPEKKYLIVLQKLMQFESCQGVIGGKPEKALYFIGKQNEQFIYLDPHYVHDANKDFKQKQQTYFCESFRKCKNTAIDSSVGISFYLRNIEQLNTFYQQINELKNQFYEDFFIFVADETPNYIKATPLHSVRITIPKQDDFELI